MKKLVIGAAALACVSIASAQTVTSANIVGYSKINKVEGLQITGSNWKTGTISEVLGMDFTGSTRLTRATQLFTYGELGYTQYYMFDDGTTKEWRNVADDSLANGATIGNGEAFFIQAVNAGEMLQSGEVNTAETNTIAIVEGLQMITYPFSADVATINDLTLTTLGSGSTRTTRADKLHVYTATGYESYMLYDNNAGIKEWRYLDDPSYVIPTDEQIAITSGMGFFYDAQNAFDWIEESPYANNL